MGHHKHNPTAIAAKNGELPPKKKSNLSKKQVDQLILGKIFQDGFVRTVFENHYEERKF